MSERVDLAVRAAIEAATETLRTLVLGSDEDVERFVREALKDLPAALALPAERRDQVLGEILDQQEAVAELVRVRLTDRDTVQAVLATAARAAVVVAGLPLA